MTTHNPAGDSWILNTDQMIFMLRHHNAIQAAYEHDAISLLRSLTTSDPYKASFGDMHFDEAYDRYEVMLESVAPRHRWHYTLTDAARQQLKALPLEEHAAVFRCLVSLLRADNPNAVFGAKKLVAARYGEQWRMRVPQAGYRIFFTVRGGTMTHDGFTYNGVIAIEAIPHRSTAYRP